jgi:predicted regulator of amino acid metabolism with ACT domain
MTEGPTGSAGGEPPVPVSVPVPVPVPVPVADGGANEATFEAIMEKFADSPSQQAVIRLILERGFSVSDEGRVVSGGIKIPNTGIAREVDVDRRVVDTTTEAILADDDLRPIFQNISAIPSLMDLAPVLDLTAVAITVRDADESGIVAAVTTAIADRGISIRQTISEDPEFTDEPRLYVITDGDLPGDLINEIREMGFVHRIELR